MRIKSCRGVACGQALHSYCTGLKHWPVPVSILNAKNVSKAYNDLSIVNKPGAFFSEFKSLITLNKIKMTAANGSNSNKLKIFPKSFSGKCKKGDIIFNTITDNDIIPNNLKG